MKTANKTFSISLYPPRKRYRVLARHLDDLGVICHIERIHSKQFQLYINGRIVKIARQRRTLNKHLVKMHREIVNKTFRPILFSTHMVKAILEGKKTQTRRIIKNVDNHYFQSLVHHATGFYTFVENGNYSPSKDDVVVVEPKYKVGDILWVRETWTPGPFENGIKTPFLYRADGERINETNGTVFKTMWRPSIFMPKKACRIFLEVTDVRVERLQDISEEDVIEEGIFVDEIELPSSSKYTLELLMKNLNLKKFKSLWESINSEDSWIENPFVWVVTFKIIERPKGFN